MAIDGDTMGHMTGRALPRNAASPPVLWETLLGFNGEWPQVFLTQQTLEGLPHLPGLENGPGFDSQGSVNFFTKYCFPNLHRIHVKAFEVEDCEFVPVHHQQK